MRATDASRAFSSVLSRAAAGELIEIDRHGQVVALLGPPRPSFISGDALLELLRRQPHPDERFAADVKALAGITVHPGDAWRS